MKLFKRDPNKSSIAWYFLSFVISLYIIMLTIDSAVVLKSLGFAWGIFEKIIPVFILVFVLMFATNYIINPRRMAKYLGENAGLKGWIVSIVGGIISTGPIYMWYPLLNDLQKKGMRNSFIATFLYNRAIKIPLMPVFILYFGLRFLLILTFVMIFFSILNGYIVEGIINFHKEVKK